jgi:galactose oxidase-like protein/flagellar hook capping protein FlgD
MIRKTPVAARFIAAALLASCLAAPAASRAADQTADGIWSLLSFPPPVARDQHVAIYDPVRNRMLVFGGLATSLKNDVWELSLSGTMTWKLLATGGTPPSPRRGASAIYDPVRDRMLIYGGAGPGPFGDLWALSLSGSPTWTQLAPTGGPPPSRSGHSAIYDPVRDRMVVFGGQTGLTYRNDAWALQLAGTPAWSLIAASGVPPDLRSRHSAIYDSVRDRMVVFGGTDGANLWGDLWSLSFTGPAWTELTPAGTPPPPRAGHQAIYDSSRDRMVLFGGDDGSGDPPGTTWALPFASSSWSELAPSGNTPLGRHDHVAVLDTAGDRMLVFGGVVELPTQELLALSLPGSTSWSTPAPAGGPAPPRTGHAAAYDPIRDRMIVFGGHGNAGVFQDTWALNLGTQVWIDLAPSGTKPVARDGHLMVYDSTHDRMVVFGGLDADNNAQNDVWTLSLGASPAWVKLSPLGSPPPPRYGAAGVYDPAGDRLVIFGGLGDVVLGDVWALSLSGTPAWSQLSPTGTPPAPRFLAGSTRNPVTNQIVIFGGTDGTLFQDAWTLSLSGSPAWAPIGASGTPPSARYEPAVIYDQTRDRLVLFGGFDGTSFCGDTWALSLTGAPAWTHLFPTGTSPTSRDGHTAIYDSLGKRMLVYGGLDGVFNDDTYELLFGDVTAVADEPATTAPAAMTLHAAYPNPFRAQATIAFDVGRPREGRVAVFDVHGRLVRELKNGLLPVGSSSVKWDGTDQRGVLVASGTYFYRIESEGASDTRKVVLLR